MIDYDQRTLAGIPLIFQLAGSMFKRCIYPAFCSVALTFMLKMLRTNGYEIWGEPVFNHPFPYQLYTFLLGFMLVFRTTLTYQRFWHGRTMLELMSSKWGDVALQAVIFDYQSKRDDLVEWKRQLLSAMSALHAVALASLGGMRHLEVLAGMNPELMTAGLNDPRVVDKTALCLQWVQAILTQRQKQGGLAVPPPILSRVYQELSTGHFGYRHAMKIHSTPFPFPYAQMIMLALVVLVITSGVFMDLFVESTIWACVFAFTAVGGFYAINEVAIELEDPFGDDENDLPMLGFQRDFNERLLMFHGWAAHNPLFDTPLFDLQFKIQGHFNSLKCATRNGIPMLPEPAKNLTFEDNEGCTINWIESPLLYDERVPKSPTDNRTLAGMEQIGEKVP